MFPVDSLSDVVLIVNGVSVVNELSKPKNNSVVLGSVDAVVVVCSVVEGAAVVVEVVDVVLDGESVCFTESNRYRSFGILVRDVSASAAAAAAAAAAFRLVLNSAKLAGNQTVWFLVPTPFDS